MFRFDWTLQPKWDAAARALKAYARIGKVTRLVCIAPEILQANGFQHAPDDGDALIAFLKAAHEPLETAAAAALLEAMAKGIEFGNEVRWTHTGLQNVPAFGDPQPA